MKIISKKILPECFKAVKSRKKNFGLMKDEDDAQPGDKLVLNEYSDNYTGHFVIRTIKYVLRNVPEYGLQEGYCIIGW